MANMREKMPVTAAWIDSLREAFGAEHIDAQIKKGMQGAQTFHAIENGHQVGTKFKHAGVWTTPYVPPKLIDTKTGKK